MRYIKLFEEYKSKRIYYHGVGKAGVFSEFKEEFIGSTSGNYGHFGKGFYFTDTYNKAKNFSIMYGGTGEVIKAYLDIKNPFIVNEKNLIKIGKKYNLNLPKKIDIKIDIKDLLKQLKDKDIIGYKLLYYIDKYNDISKGWEDFMKEYPNTYVSSLNLNLNLIGDWYNDTIGERYYPTVSDYTIKELKDIGIEPKIIQDYDEDVRMDYLTNLGQNSDIWTDAIKNEEHDGIDAGDEIVVFKNSQIEIIENIKEKSSQFIVKELYHSSSIENLRYFDKSKIGTQTNSLWNGYGFYFSDNKEEAKLYANYLYEVKVKLFKTLDISNLDDFEFINKLANIKLNEYIINLDKYIQKIYSNINIDTVMFSQGTREWFKTVHLEYNNKEYTIRNLTKSELENKNLKKRFTYLILNKEHDINRIPIRLSEIGDIINITNTLIKLGYDSVKMNNSTISNGYEYCIFNESSIIDIIKIN